MRIHRQLLLICCAGALLAPAAGAQTSIAPPGKSGADQYFETIPSARGNVAPPPANGTGAAAATAGERRLARLGKDGQAAAAVAAAAAPGSGPHARGRSAPSGSDASSTSLRRLITGSDSGGLGIWLPILLGASLLGAIVFALLRRRDPEAS
jgi:hypothetical protein